MPQLLYTPEEPEQHDDDPQARILKPPSCKLDSEGSGIVGLVYDVSMEPQKEYGTGQVMTTQAGKIKNVCLVKVLIVTATGDVNTKISDDVQPVQPSDRVTCWLTGPRMKQWDDSSRKLPQGVTVGTRIRWFFVREEPLPQAGFNPRKHYDLALEQRDNNNPAWVPWNQACDQVRAEYQTAVQMAEAEQPANIEGYTASGEPLVVIPSDAPRKMGLPSGPITAPTGPPP